MTAYLLVGAGGFLGAICRHGAHLGLAGLGAKAPLWLSTLAVNVLGCFVGGLLLAGELPRGESWRLFLVVGVLGGFTTFSAFGTQAFGFLQEGAVGRALLHALAHVTLGVLAVWLGHLALARA